MKNALTLTVSCDTPLIADGVPSERLIEWKVEAPRAAALPPSQRPPLNLALVLDRSGSMAHSGKLDYARRMACLALDQLCDRDRVAVIAFDDEIRTLSPSVAVTEEGRRRLQEQIAGLTPGGSTDLHGGWLRGAGEVAENVLAGGINRVLLLTDGQANQGLTDPELVTQQAFELHQRGVSTSTFGVGEDYNEHLLRPMAERAGGHYAYIAHPTEILQALGQELGELLSVVARSVRLEITWPTGVAVELFGGLPHEASAKSIHVPLGEMSSCEQRLLFTRVLTPPGKAGAAKAVRGRLWWIGLEGEQADVAADVEFRHAPAADVAESPVDAGVRQRAARIDMEEAASRALEMGKRGEFTEAREVLLRAYAANAPSLNKEDAAEYDVLARRLASGMSAAAMKSRDSLAYRRRNTRE